MRLFTRSGLAGVARIVCALLLLASVPSARLSGSRETCGETEENVSQEESCLSWRCGQRERRTSEAGGAYLSESVVSAADSPRNHSSPFAIAPASLVGRQLPLRC